MVRKESETGKKLAVFDQNTLNDIQRFLYTQTSRVLENKEKKRTILFSSEVTGSTFLNRSVYINRFDGVFQPSDIQTENYSSSFFCDLEQDKFWDYLYSNLWNDKGILRVLSGELYTALDICLREMLQEDKISRHLTNAYLKVKGKENKDESTCDFNPETVQVEFTYYNRKNPAANPLSETFSDLVTEVQSANHLTAESDYPSEVSINEVSKVKSDTEVESEPEEESHLVLAAMEPHRIRINLAHFHCPITHDIENYVDSDCESLENEIQRGNWITKAAPPEKGRLVRTNTKSMMSRGLFRESNTAVKKQPNQQPSFKTSKKDVEVTEVEVKEKFLMPLSIDINLSVLGNIMEREKFLKFKKMTPKERKQFFLSDERIMKVTEKLKLGDNDEPVWNIPFQAPKKPSQKPDKITDIKNMRHFATLVLGITESPAIYRTLIWMGKCENEEKSKTTLPTSSLRLTRANFNVENEDDLTSLQLESKGELFRSRNERSFVRTFTYHPNFFKPEKIVPTFETKRLRKSYSPEHYQSSYNWEKDVHCKFRLTKTKIVIPDLSGSKLEISREMILKALGDFIVRKERVISSKGVDLTSFAFIRPVYLNKLFF